MDTIWAFCRKCCRKFQITRQEQDKFALKSQEKALIAQKQNKFKRDNNFKKKQKMQKLFS